jgi:hypothetical protein
LAPTSSSSPCPPCPPRSSVWMSWNTASEQGRQAGSPTPGPVVASRPGLCLLVSGWFPGFYFGTRWAKLFRGLMPLAWSASQKDLHQSSGACVVFIQDAQCC